MVDREDNIRYKIIITERLDVLRKSEANLVLNHHNFQPLLEIEDNVSIARLVRYIEVLETHTAHFVIAAFKVSIITVHL